MPNKLCPTCHALVDSRAYAAHYESHRGSRRERGIGPVHEAFARELSKFPHHFTCAVCGQYPVQDEHLTVGHIRSRSDCLALGIDPDVMDNMQPECRNCNLSKG